MKRKNNEGFSLVEVLVAIVLLGILVVPICSSLLLTFRMNEKTDSMLQAQLAVSSAVETLMAEGIDEEILEQKVSLFSAETDLTSVPYDDETGRFSDVTVLIKLVPVSFDKSGYSCYCVEVKSDLDDAVIVTTQIREKEAGA